MDREKSEKITSPSPSKSWFFLDERGEKPKISKNTSLGIPVLAEEFSVFAEKFSVLAEEFLFFYDLFLKSGSFLVSLWLGDVIL